MKAPKLRPTLADLAKRAWLCAALLGIPPVAIGVEAGAALSPGDRFRDCPSCPQMVVVPAGSFVMGSSSGEKGHFVTESPQRRVRIPQPFAVGVYEVTFDEWDACERDFGCGIFADDAGWGRGAQPVINVGRNDAQEYLGWLSEKTGLDYRLLSEAEWEYAARAGTTTPFHFGWTISTNQANYAGKWSFYDRGSRGFYRERSVPVGQFPPNGFGLHDVHGNVQEWVQDCFIRSYDGAPRDGSARESGDCAGGVLRGGSWLDYAKDLRSASRAETLNLDLRFQTTGFRVARTLTP